MKTLLIALFSLGVFNAAHSQDLKKYKAYTPTEDANEKLSKAIKQAKAEKKHVLVQIGGNWCIWCARFDDFVATDKSIDSLVHANFVVYHLNYSEENKNEKILAKYKFPQRFGFPVFLVLDGKGNLLHTQNTGYLENGQKSYDKKAVVGFFNDWRPAALDPSQYKEKK